MGYRITYGQTVTYKFFSNKSVKARRRHLIIGIIVLALFVGAFSFKTHWKSLLPGDEQITYLALSHMVDNLKDGGTMKEAVTAFCQELVSYDK